MIYIRPAGDYLYGKWLFTWLSPMMSLMVSFCAVFFFQWDVLDEICDPTESISEGFPVGMSVSPHVCVILDLILMSLFLR